MKYLLSFLKILVIIFGGVFVILGILFFLSLYTPIYTFLPKFIQKSIQTGMGFHIVLILYGIILSGIITISLIILSFILKYFFKNKIKSLNN